MELHFFFFWNCIFIKEKGSKSDLEVTKLPLKMSKISDDYRKVCGK